MDGDAYTRALELALWEDADVATVARLDDGQREMVEAFLGSEHPLFVALMGRRRGKSHVATTLAAQVGLTVPNAVVRLAAPTAKQVLEIFEPLWSKIFATCPPHLKPTRKATGEWRFPSTGARVLPFGCDSVRDADRGRGTEMTLGIVDEAGSIDCLRYVVEDVLLPQTLTTGGKIFLCSSPPTSPDHPFASVYIPDAERLGTFRRSTVYDAKHIAPHVIERLREETIRKDGEATWRREYLAQIVVDPSRAVVPEFTAREAEIVVERARPESFYAYVAGDFGWKDLTAVVFAYHDFERDVLYIEDEVVESRRNSGEIAALVREKEEALWPTPTSPKGRTPQLRVADAPLQQIADLSEMHRLDFVPARKDDADAALNALRVAIANGRIEVHPRCRVTIRHLREAVWNTQRTSYERSEGSGHFDAVDAVKYLHRHVDRVANPFPVLRPGVSIATHAIPQKTLDEMQADRGEVGAWRRQLSGNARRKLANWRPRR